MFKSLVNYEAIQLTGNIIHIYIRLAQNIQNSCGLKITVQQAGPIIDSYIRLVQYAQKSGE